MDFVTSMSMQVLWNGDKSSAFPPSCSICQGDPLSPYLFALCVERLAHIIKDVISGGEWKPIQLNGHSPRLSHLFFADDLVRFAECSV